jgi:hypothetical protein
MTTEQLLASFPGSTKRREMKAALDNVKAAGGELAYLTFDPAMDAKKGAFADVANVSVGLRHGKVADLLVMYVGTNWKSLDEWVAKVAQSYNLPAPWDWEVGPSESPNKVLVCQGIEIEASTQGGGSSIRIRITGANR